MNERGFDASDPEQVKLQKIAAGRRKQLDENVLRMLMGTTEGRSWVWRQLEACHIFATSFDPNNDRISAFNEGERNVGLRLLAMVIGASPEGYMQMMKESKENG